ncbi:MAG TPA: PBP1A family penicillin-binding protein [Acetobacteraceae bacterium]|nr:PBP1A family penicillin-binding protein [Acetobacteraceae bacterium]
MAPNELRAEAPLDPTRVSRPAAPPPPPPRERRPKEPRPRRRRGGIWRLFRFAFLSGLVLLAIGGIAGYVAYRHVSADLPDYRWLATYEPPQMSRIYASDSRLMAELATERRIFVPIEAIPRRVQQAFVAAEDQRFWEHGGIDPLGILRALVTAAENLGRGRRMGGASTITQQVAKNMLVGSERSIMRKLREAILAVRIEGALSKERILELYLNEIYLGSQAYGVAAAAQMYFNKSLDELSIAEIAFLAALPKAPNNYNPQRFPEAARIRRDWVIDRMAEDGYITAEEARAAKAEPINARPTRRPDMVAGGQHYTEEVRRELIQRFGPEQTTMGGLVVRTSIEPPLQQAAERALREGLLGYDRRRGGWRGPLTRITATTTEWMPALEATPRPPGGLPEWQMAVVLEVREREARVAWLERPDRRAAAQPRTGTLTIEDHAWARAATIPRVPQAAIQLGPQPRRMADIVAVGDVVFVEPQGVPAAQGRVVTRADRVILRQAPMVEGAVVALDPQTGRVLAMAGGWSFDRSWYNRATQAMRQPGSSFKPFVYIAALEQGIPPNQELLDEPVEIMTAQGVWRPQNYSAGTANGWVTMRQAMERSLNLVTVRLAQQVGMERVSDAAGRFGVIPNMPRYLAMSLGAGETTVLRMAAGYAAFANGGRQVVPSFIDSVQDRRGRVIWRADHRQCDRCAAPGPDDGPPELSGERPRVTDPIAAFQMVSILQGVVQRGTGTRAGAGLNRPIAGKTGTTDDYKDNWFVGFTPDIVVAVWLGFDEPRSLGQGETGGQNAAPIFREVLAAALRDSPPVPFRAPPGVALVRIPVGNGTILEPFRPGTENGGRRRMDDQALFEGPGGAAIPGVPGPPGTGGPGVDRNLGGLY